MSDSPSSPGGPWSPRRPFDPLSPRGPGKPTHTHVHVYTHKRIHCNETNQDYQFFVSMDKYCWKTETSMNMDSVKH